MRFRIRWGSCGVSQRVRLVPTGAGLDRRQASHATQAKTGVLNLPFALQANVAERGVGQNLGAARITK